MAEVLSEGQLKFDHYFGIFAGVASIAGLLLGIRALLKEKEYEQKFGLLAPLLEEEGLGAVPKYETLKQLDMTNPEKPKKKEKLYHALVHYYLCDDMIVNRQLHKAAIKRAGSYDWYCTLPAHRSNWSFPHIKKRGIPKKDALYIKKWADKNLAWKPDYGSRLILDKRGKSRLF